MQVFVKGLRCAESVRVASAEIDVLRWIEPEVCAWAEDQSVYKVVLIETTSDEDAPTAVLPLILCICTDDSHGLVCCSAVTGHVIPEVVLIVFKSDSQVSRHEQAIFCLIYILCASDPCEVLCISICIRVHASTVVAVSVYVLH